MAKGLLRCIQCGYQPTSLRRRACLICKGGVWARGINGDKDILFSPIGDVMVKSLMEEGVTKPIAWQQLVIIVERVKIMKRMKMEPFTGWSSKDTVYTAFDGNVTKIREESGKEDDNYCFWTEPQNYSRRRITVSRRTKKTERADPKAPTDLRGSTHQGTQREAPERTEEVQCDAAHHPDHGGVH